MTNSGDRSLENHPSIPAANWTTDSAAPTLDSLDVDGVRLRCVVRGGGPSLLFLHGWGGRSENFGRLLSDFGATRSVCAFDFPGFGRSDPAPSSWNLGDFAAVARGVIRARSLDRPDVIAHSFGGRVAIKIAAEHPDEIGRLILVGTPGFRRRRSLSDYAQRGAVKVAKVVAAYGGTLGKRLRDSVYGLVASTDYQQAGPLKAVFVRIVNEDLSGLVPRVRARTLLVWGQDDREVPLATARAMQRAMPDASLSVIAHAGHFCFLDQPEYFRLLVAKFLR